MNLECSTKGDKRFSALYAKVDGYSIEERYQMSKRFLYKGKIVHPKDFKQAKYWQRRNEYKLLDFVAFGDIYSLEYLSMYYKLLWYLYLIENKNLITYAEKFNTFSDYYKNSNTMNSQCDIIEIVAKKGINELYNECKFFIHKYLF